MPSSGPSSIWAMPENTGHTHTHTRSTCSGIQTHACTHTVAASKHPPTHTKNQQTKQSAAPSASRHGGETPQEAAGGGVFTGREKKGKRVENERHIWRPKQRHDCSGKGGRRRRDVRTATKKRKCIKAIPVFSIATAIN